MVRLRLTTEGAIAVDHGWCDCGLPKPSKVILKYGGQTNTHPRIVATENPPHSTKRGKPTSFNQPSNHGKPTSFNQPSNEPGATLAENPPHLPHRKTNRRRTRKKWPPGNPPHLSFSGKPSSSPSPENPPSRVYRAITHTAEQTPT